MMAAVLAVCLWSVAAQGLAATPGEIYQKTGPAVVFVRASAGTDTANIGTGSIVRSDGLVITNAHIFTTADSPQLKSNITVFLKPRRVTGNRRKDLKLRHRARLLDYNISLDLALLQIEQFDRSLARIEFADSERVAVGDQVYAIGHPEQGGLWSLTTGVISAFRQNHGGVSGKNLFQTDASINRGNSGGPLLDVNGNMVGINAMIARKAADGLTITDVNFSIMSNVASAWLNGLGYDFPADRTVTSGPRDRTTVEYEADQGLMSDSRAKPRNELQQPGAPENVQPPASKRDKARNDPQRSPQGSQGNEPDISDNKSADSKNALHSSPAETSPGKSESGGSAGRKILTPKAPYKMSQLLRDLQEMEDIMADMRGKLKKYRNKEFQPKRPGFDFDSEEWRSP